MEHDKFIYACNHEGCPVEFLHVYVLTANSSKYETEYAADEEHIGCPACGNHLTLCEVIYSKENHV